MRELENLTNKTIINYNNLF